ncbi:ATPase AAA [Pararhizobium polonicum]|uniref:ATPase AAA n=1 Tax=Pararhizobium polonicum TaxID=1612624 RepID=A0A1C7P2V8_9HYPH|nr:AAA family ATPase [Pararhizobium polonicum]OBZ94014.1 ATPase AAA [Pararhizobium polonicum]
MPSYISGIEQALPILRGVSRVLVIGCSGGGKSTLSRKLSGRLDLPYVSMDRDFYWLPGWTKRAKADERALIAATVAQDRWIMDGTGASSFDLRLPRTDLVVWVRVPRPLCLWGLICRVASSFGRVRPDMAPGCPEQLPDREFLSYIWNFDRRVSPIIVERLDRYAPDMPVLTLRSRSDMRALVARLQEADDVE